MILAIIFKIEDWRPSPAVEQLLGIQKDLTLSPRIEKKDKTLIFMEVWNFSMEEEREQEREKREFSKLMGNIKLEAQETQQMRAQQHEP